MRVRVQQKNTHTRTHTLWTEMSIELKDLYLHFVCAAQPHTATTTLVDFEEKRERENKKLQKTHEIVYFAQCTNKFAHICLYLNGLFSLKTKR